MILSITPALVVASNVPAQFSYLANHSPFGLSGASSPGRAPLADPLEFRAVLEENGKHYFSVLETNSQRSTWVELNNSANGISVKNYSPTENTVSVEYRGLSLVLPLKGGRISLVSAADVTPPSLPQPASKADQEYGDQPFRIGHVVEEMQLREAVRQKTPLSSSGS